MPVDATWRIQATTGTGTGTSGLAPSLPNPTQPGSTLVLFIGVVDAGSVVPQNQSYDPPWFDDMHHSGVCYIWRRDNQPAGETSWPMTASGLAGTQWAWWITEWAGLSTTANPDAFSTGGGGGPTVAIIPATQANDFVAGSTTPPSPDVADFAALAVAMVPGASGAWPAGRTWSSPWSEAAAVQVGTGSGGGSTDLLLLVAEAYPQATGSLDATMTWDITGGGTYTDKTVNLGAVVYQPAQAPQPTVVMTS